MTKQLYIKSNLPFGLLTINIINASDKQLEQISLEMGLALSLDEMKKVQAYFFKKKRRPNDIELQTVGQTWSEHCYHKTFKGDILSTKGEVVVQNMIRNYIAKATKELKLPWCFSVFEDNAGIVDFEKGFGIAIKIETHNHPSAVEPFGGAATGLGGVIRDPLGVWAEPIACTNVLCFGPLNYDHHKIPKGVKHPRYLLRGVVAGIGYYGNNMGIPTINGAICFDEGYIGNPLVYCGCIGILPLKKYIKDTKPGDAIVLVGGKTGKDGIHGVTFASLELNEKSEASRPAVQIANPIEEEKVCRAIMRVRDEELGSGITDLGGGGLSSAVCEKANQSKCGAIVDLNKIPLKTVNIDPWEMWISESQERMLLSVRKRNLQKVIDIFQSEDVEATCIGWFTKERTIALNYAGVRLALLDTDFLFQPPKSTRVANWVQKFLIEPSFPEPEFLTDHLMQLMSAPNIASKEFMVRTYDHEVQGNTVLKPFQGRFSGPNDASVIKPLAHSWQGVVISCGINPQFGKIDPYWMAASGIDEAIRNNVSVGGRRIALLDNFSWGNPEKPDRMGGLVRAAQACYDYAIMFGTPFVSGKDSLYNESSLGAVTPTLLITGLGIIPDVRKAISVDLKKPRSFIYIVGKTYPELGGSEYYKMKGFIGNNVPKVDAVHMKKSMDAITTAIDLGYIKSCHDLSDGGLAVAAAEMALSGENGLEIDLSKVPHVNISRNDYMLFSESNSRFLLEVAENYYEEFEKTMSGSTYSRIGEVKDDQSFITYGLKGRNIINCDISQLREAWKNTFGEKGE